jgi:hypothetical protein
LIGDNRGGVILPARLDGAGIGQRLRVGGVRFEVKLVSLFGFGQAAGAEMIVALVISRLRR